MKHMVSLGLLLLGSLPSVLGANWPSWRGPNQNGSTPETHFPLNWDRQKNVKWRAALPEPGNSSPIVWGNSIFVTQSLEDGKRRTVMAFDRATGKLRWQEGVTFEATESHHKTNPHGSASPVTDGDRVVATFGSAGVAAFDFAGKVLWKTDLGPQTHDWGQGSSPVLQGDQVIVYHGPGPFSTLYALGKADGKVRWKVALKEVSPPERWDGFAGKSDGMIGTFSTPLVVSGPSRTEIILPVVNELRAFSATTGEPLWHAEGMNPLVYASPTLAGDTLVAFGGFFGSAIFIKPGGNGDRTSERLVYERRMKRHTIGSPVYRDGYLYQSVTDGFAQCLELATGKLVWEERLPTSGGSGQTWASMVLAGDRIYVINQAGDTLVLRAAPKYELLAQNPLGELSNSTLALSEGEIFARTEAALYCIGDSGARPGATN